MCNFDGDRASRAVETEMAKQHAVPVESAPLETASLKTGPLEILRSRADIERYLARLDQEAITEQLEMERSIAEARRPHWWTFGIRTFVP